MSLFWVNTVKSLGVKGQSVSKLVSEKKIFYEIFSELWSLELKE